MIRSQSRRRTGAKIVSNSEIYDENDHFNSIELNQNKKYKHFKDSRQNHVNIFQLCEKNVNSNRQVCLPKFKYEIDVSINESQQEVQLPTKREFQYRQSDPHLTLKSNYRKKEFSQIPKEEQLLKKIELQRIEAKSILFNNNKNGFSSQRVSKIFDVYPQRYPSENEQDDIQIFKSKVNKVNGEIEQGLNHLEKMLLEVKLKKQRQGAAKEKQHQFSLMKQRQNLLKFNRQRQNRDQVLKQRQQIERERQKLKERFLQKQRERQEMKIKVQLQVIKNQQQSLVISRQIDKVQESKIQLVGEYKDSQQFPPEFTLLINRLARQLQLDAQFTSIVSEYKKKGIDQRIKKIIFNEISKHKFEEIPIQSFFTIQASEVDPLDSSCFPVHIQSNFTSEIQNQCAMKLYKKYRQIQTHFTSRLKNQCTSESITILFEELNRFNFINDSEGSESVTIGHLMSYINLRTNRSFRNRSFVKMIKRLNLNNFKGLLNQFSFREIIAQ